MKSGWIKLYRKVFDNPIVWRSSEPFSRRDAWIDLLLTVNHEPADIMINNRIIHIKRGQTWTSYRKLADRWRWSIGKVRRYTDCLERESMLTQNAHTDGTLLTIVNYELFQGERYAVEHTHGTQTERRQTHAQTTNKNINNDNNDKKLTMRDNRAECESVFNKLWAVYPEKKGKAKVSDKDKRRLAKVGLEQGLRAIERYKQEVEGSSYLHYKHGSTFFHSGIYDYTDDTYTPTVEKKTEAIQRKNRAEAEGGSGLASTGLNEQQQREAAEKSDQIIKKRQQEAAALSSKASPFKGGAAAEMRRRQRKAVKNDRADNAGDPV